MNDTREFLMNMIAAPTAGEVLIIPRNTYHFYPDDCEAVDVPLSNNDSGLRHLGLHLNDLKDMTIDFSGSRLIMHGRIIPILFSNCSRVTLKGVQIDWAKEYYGEARVLSADGNECLISIENNCDMIEHKGIIYYGDIPAGCEDLPAKMHFLQYDEKRKQPTENAMDLWIDNSFRIEKQNGNTIKITGEIPPELKEGALYITTNHIRTSPAIVMDRCDRMVLQSSEINFALGMAVLAQFCEDVSIENCRVRRSGNRTISTLADATHFVMCSGKILLKECDFQHQMDDASNVHGIYAVVNAIINDRTVEVEMRHYQQKNIDFSLKGEKIAFYRYGTMDLQGELTVLRSRRSGEYRMTLELSGSISPDVSEGSIVENMTRRPDFSVMKCRFTSNRARGILITTAGKVSVRDTHFQSCGSAIRISGDTVDWFESGAVSDVDICGNLFETSNTGSPEWGIAAIDVHPDLPEAFNSVYHRNITIRNNDFGSCKKTLFARNAGDIVIRNNRSLGEIDIEEIKSSQI